MKARPFKQSSSTAHPPMVHNEIVEEALRHQAAKRPAKTPPRIMPVTPTLPKVSKPHKFKRSSGKR
jgi:hypothetical protein